MMLRLYNQTSRINQGLIIVSKMDIKEILSLIVAIPLIIFVASAAWTITSNPGDPENAEIIAGAMENVVTPYLVLVLLFIIRHFRLW